MSDNVVRERTPLSGEALLQAGCRLGEPSSAAPPTGPARRGHLWSWWVRAGTRFAAVMVSQRSVQEILITQEPNPLKACPVCGCPQAALLLMTVECASPHCRWHSLEHERQLSPNARSQVVLWHTTADRERLDP